MHVDEVQKKKYAMHVTKKKDIYLQIKNNRARAGECFVTAGDTLHPDGEGAISFATGILKRKKNPHYIIKKAQVSHFLKDANKCMAME